MAMAGFSPNELDVTVHENALLVTRRRRPTKRTRTATAIYTAASRGARLSDVFSLADHMKVTGAHIDNGMVHVELVHEVPEAVKPRKIAIGASEPVQPQVTKQKAAA